MNNYGNMNRDQWRAYLAYHAARQTGRGVRSSSRLGWRIGRGLFRVLIRWVLDGRVRRHRYLR